MVIRRAELEQRLEQAPKGQDLSNNSKESQQQATDAEKDAATFCGACGALFGANDDYFCPDCGAPREDSGAVAEEEETGTGQAERFCGACGAALASDEYFCPDCGQPQDAENEGEAEEKLNRESDEEVEAMVQEALSDDDPEEPEQQEEAEMVEGRLNCNACGTECESGDQWCPDCGAPLDSPQASSVVEESSGDSGQQISHEPEQLSNEPEQLSAAQFCGACGAPFHETDADWCGECGAPKDQQSDSEELQETDTQSQTVRWCGECGTELEPGEVSYRPMTLCDGPGNNN